MKDWEYKGFWDFLIEKRRFLKEIKSNYSIKKDFLKDLEKDYESFNKYNIKIWWIESLIGWEFECRVRVEKAIAK